MTEFALGKESFGIAPARPTRSMLIQAEDDDDDVTEMAWLINRLGLDQAQQKLVQDNTRIIRLRGPTDEDFISTVEDYLQQWRADILWINPYSVYVGAEMRDERAQKKFLYGMLDPLLEKHRCGAVLIMHTPKTNFRSTDKWSLNDWIYAAAGSAILTNWTRANLVIDPTSDDKVFRFIAGKHREKIGWNAQIRYFAHSIQDNKVLWVPATAQQEADAQKSQSRIKNIDLQKVSKLVPLLDPDLKETIENKIRSELGLSRDSARAALKELAKTGQIHYRPISNPNKTGRPLAGWARTSDAREQ